MSNYETVDESTEKLISDIIEEEFNLAGCVVAPIFLTDKKKSKGKYELAKLTKPNSLVKMWAFAATGNEPDYLLIIDANVFAVLSDDDKKLLIMHALEYADVDFDKKSPYGLRGAEVETFYDEIERTKEDPQWQQKHQDIATNLYTKED